MKQSVLTLPKVNRHANTWQDSLTTCNDFENTEMGCYFNFLPAEFSVSYRKPPFGDSTMVRQYRWLEGQRLRGKMRQRYRAERQVLRIQGP